MTDQPQSKGMSVGLLHCWFQMPNGERVELSSAITHRFSFSTDHSPIEIDSCSTLNGVTYVHGIYHTEDKPNTLKLIGRECEEEDTP